MCVCVCVCVCVREREREREREGGGGGGERERARERGERERERERYLLAMMLNLFTGVPSSLLIDLTMFMLRIAISIDVGRQRSSPITASNWKKVFFTAAQSSAVNTDVDAPINFLCVSRERPVRIIARSS